MAFDLRRFTRVSLADNAGALTLQDSSIVNGPALFTYASATDAIATIEAANYFNDEGSIYDLQVGDVIIAEGSDASTMLQVATVDTTTSPKTITVVTFTPVGSVGTANIQALAVTTAKIAANAVTFAKLDISVLQSATVAFTAAQVAAMYATPRQLVAAGGAGTLIIVDSVWISATFVSAQYTAGGVIAPQYGNTAHGAGVAATGTIAAATLNAVAASSQLSFPNAAVVAANTACENLGIFLSNATAAFATGDSTLSVTTYYRIITPV